MKKLLILGLAFLAPAVFAMGEAPQHFTPPARSVFDGFYLGGAVSGVDMFSNTTFTDQEKAANSTDIIIKDKVGTMGVGVALTGGYGQTFDDFYVGAELNARYTFNEGTYSTVEAPASNNAAATSKNYRNKVGTDWNFGLAAKLGWLPTQIFPAKNVMLYVLLGGEYTNFKVADVKQDTTVLFKGYSKGAWGFAPGVGAAFAIAPNLFVNVQYVYSMYGKISKTVEPVKSEVTPTINTFTVGLNWQLPWQI